MRDWRRDCNSRDVSATTIAGPDKIIGQLVCVCGSYVLRIKAYCCGKIMEGRAVFACLPRVFRSRETCAA